MERLRVGWLALSAAIFLALGVSALAAPASFLPSVGMRMVGPGANVEVRAMYGGLELGLGLLLVGWTWRPARRRDALWVLAASRGGLGLGRLLGLAAAGGGPRVMVAFCVFELVGAVGSVWLARA